MPNFLFKLQAICTVGIYMFWQIVILPYVMIRYRGNVQAWIDRKIQLFARFCMRRLRVDLDIQDQALLAKVDWTRPVFVMGNHCSYMDIPVVFLAIERTIGFIAKAELGKIPFLNFWMKKIGCLLVKRGAGGGANKVREALSKLEQPRIFIFPEGTRSKNGELLPFKSGGCRLALEAEAIILPVVMKGTAATWEKRKDSKTCKVTARILEPIDTKVLLAENPNIDPKGDLTVLVRNRMAAAL